MARRRTTTSRRPSSIHLDRVKLGSLLLLIGVLRFFAYFMAPEAPLMYWLSYPVQYAVGQQGSVYFFAYLALVGAIILVRPAYYTSWLFKFGLLVLLCISTILNFGLLELGALKGTLTAPMKVFIMNHGGWFGYVGLWGSIELLGANIMAIKWFIYLCLAIVIIAVIMYYKIRIPVPSIKLEALKSRYEPPARSTKTPSRPVVSQKDLTPAQKSLDFPHEGLLSKLRKSMGATFSGSEHHHDDVGSEDRSVFEPTQVDIGNRDQTSTLKNLIKDKISKKLQVKEDEQLMHTMHISFPADKPTYPLQLLDEDLHKEPGVSEDRLLEKAESVREKLAEFGIQVEIEGCNIGPSVLQFKIKPEAGVKVSKIENLKKDISLAIKAKSLRILAPIPGTDSVGIELPNPKPQMVRLREILGSLTFTQLMNKNFTNLALGTGIDGSTIIKSLEEMPHLLVAGATGSGKSVGVNSFILSLMYQNSPAELKFLMVDPKQVELGIYDGMPYLLAPIITEADKAVKILKRAVDHMNERYLKLKQSKVRNIIEYNEKVGEHEKMYRMVIIIDELADLMMSGSKKDTELYITRIAQMARAVGMHLILATQRPSVNVITGLIKANIPTRIAFGVVQNIDSRCILDQSGAEDLVGKGDMLYLDPKTKFPIRVQGCFVSTLETELVLKEIKSKYLTSQGINEGATYHPEIIRILEAKGERAGGGEVSDEDEGLVSQAIEVILETQKASATMLQRKLGIGFPRAAKIIDILEDRGMIGPQEGAKPREIFM